MEISTQGKFSFRIFYREEIEKWRFHASILIFPIGIKKGGYGLNSGGSSLAGLLWTKDQFA